MVLFLLHLAGAAALLIWSIRLIRTGIERGFMPQLRLILRRSESSRPLAALAGTAAATLMQSSTAVALVVAGFTVSGGLAAAAGLAIMLGADLGSAIASQILLLRADWLPPLLLLVGATLFLRFSQRSVRQSGRALVGLGMVFLSLGLVRETVAPLGSSDVVSVVVGHLRADLLSAYLLGAILAYALQSSLAAVLMIVTFVSGGLLTVNAGAALVLGANMGGGIVPLILTLSMPAAARRVVIANLVFRGGLSLVALVAMLLWTPDLSPLAPAAHRQVINLHLLFNLGVLLLGLPIAPVLARLARMLLPDRRAPVRAENGTLEPAALEVPGRALACARREVLRMSETILAMLVPALTLYRKWDDAVAREILDAEDEVDRMHFGTKLYLAKLQERSLGADHSRQAMDLAAIANNLEDAGDQISTHMFDMARRMHGEGLVFSNEGWRDLSDFHDRVVSNAQLALDVLSSGDPDLARQLLEEKDHIRNLERELQERHLRRLRDGLAESIETSNLHQETLRALKLINTSLCSVAYPIAEETGLLLSSRLSRREGAATEDETATNDNNTEARA